MKIGITYDLRRDYEKEGLSDENLAEFDSPDTVDAIERALTLNGYVTDRIGNIRALVARLAEGERWDMVFNIAEGLHGFGREAQIPALLDAYSIPYTFSEPLALSLTLHKAMTKRVLRDLGLPTADFRLVEAIEDVAAINLPYPLFAKPVAEGTSKGINAMSKIASNDELESVCRRLLVQFAQPVLVETYLPGREFTVGVIGTGKEARAAGALEIIMNGAAESCEVYTYLNKEECESRVEYRLVKDAAAKAAENVALAAWRGAGCRDGGRVDVRLDVYGVPNVVEINPLPGLHPTHSDLPIMCSQAGMEYKQLIGQIMESALKRSRRTTGGARMVMNV
ncbi:MAG: D-alanine--D-alanine ligase [Nitrospinae bacterium]|nr:D-alanine--D-alanine ligase [Nitrospinota bacterium]